jgi:hypothetical protein
VESPIPVDTLLAVWKKIFSNRFAWVFKKPVRDEEAPGYSERIAFPMDLSLVRKRIVVKNIQSFRELHESIALIAHNCVKYNGRETDYGKVARDFEVMADQMILQAVSQYHNQSKTTTEATAPTTKTSNAAVTTTVDATTTTTTRPSTAAPSIPTATTTGTSDGNAEQGTEVKPIPKTETQKEGADPSKADPSVPETAPAKAAEESTTSKLPNKEKSEEMES